METKSIILKLKTTPYQFTEAGKVRDQLRKMPVEDRDIILEELRQERHKSENLGILKVLDQLLGDFRG